MTRVAILVVALLMAAVLLIQAPPAAAMGKTHDLSGVVVSVNIEGKTITLKDTTGASMTYPVLDSATGDLKNLKGGENVTLTCQDNEKGEHQGIARIQSAAAAGDKKKSSS
jgi:Cu/Ag efflux protein CusF